MADIAGCSLGHSKTLNIAAGFIRFTQMCMAREALAMFCKQNGSNVTSLTSNRGPSYEKLYRWSQGFGMRKLLI